MVGKLKREKQKAMSACGPGQPGCSVGNSVLKQVFRMCIFLGGTKNLP